MQGYPNQPYGQPGMPQQGMYPGMQQPGMPQQGMGMPGQMMPQQGMGMPGMQQPMMGQYGIPMPQANMQLWGQRTPWYAVYYQRCNPQVIQQIYGWFYAVDTDRSGQLDVNEITRALQQAGMNYALPTMQKAVQIFDMDKTGNINPNEFVALYQFLCTVRESFQSFDRDRSGSLDWMELAGALQMLQMNLSPMALNALVAKFDPTRTGRLSLEAYTNVCLLLGNLYSFWDTKRYQRSSKKKNKQYGTIEMTFDELVTLTPFYV